MRDARWTPLELGLAAGLKEIAKMALLPVALSIRCSGLAVLQGSMRVLLQEWLVICYNEPQAMSPQLTGDRP